MAQTTHCGLRMSRSLRADTPLSKNCALCGTISESLNQYSVHLVTGVRPLGLGNGSVKMRRPCWRYVMFVGSRTLERPFAAGHSKGLLPASLRYDWSVSTTPT